MPLHENIIILQPPWWETIPLYLVNNQHLGVKKDFIMKEGPKDMVIKKLILTFTHGLVNCGRFHKGKLMHVFWTIPTRWTTKVKEMVHFHLSCVDNHYLMV
jgi:hypothetical protein